MGAFCVNKLDIFSDTGTYELVFDNEWAVVSESLRDCSAIIIDKRVHDLYADKLELDETKIISIQISEEIKNPQTCLDICEKLIMSNVTRDKYIVAIGGGVIQDLVTLSASIYMRGIDWIFLPTTLLAQADSCIGGKSSINFKSWKNILGNFYEPTRIYVNSQFLNTLEDVEIRSGIGEILKVNLLSGQKAVEEFEMDFTYYQNNSAVLDRMIIKALELKNRILRIDALDKGPRLKMNYGHSFGHSLESATSFGIPHGLAVTIGLDIANYFSYQLGLISSDLFDRLHGLLELNMRDSDYCEFNNDDFFMALGKDKKNRRGQYGLIVPVGVGEVELRFFDIGSRSNDLIAGYFDVFYRNKL